jgi:ankyrin repeat protein
MVKLLLGKGAKLEDATLLCHSHVNFPIIKYLLKRGVNPKATDDDGYTLLHKQCKNGNLKNVKYLIQHYHADVNANNNYGLTPLHVACKGIDFGLHKRNYLKIVKFLIEEQNADPAVTCNEGKSALHYAAENRDPSILRYLIEDQKQDIKATDNEGRTVLHLACQTDFFFDDKWAIQKYLLEEHPMIMEAKDKEGKTALYYCLDNFVKKEIYEFDNFRPIALILATKANILKKQENKDTDYILDWIKQSYDNDMKKSKGEDETVSCLIAGLEHFHKKLDKKDENRIDVNALLYLTLCCNRTDIAKFMFNQDFCYIENHFNAVEANSRRKLLLKSYLEFSCENGLLDLIWFLFQDINNRQESFQHLAFDGSFVRSACKNKHIDIFKYLLEAEKAKDEAAAFLKDFSLHYACARGSLEMVQYLIKKKKIDIKVKDKVGRTPLHFACMSDSIEITKYLILEQNANINISDNKGRTPLHLACKIGSIEISQYLIEKQDVNIKTTDKKSRSVWHFACKTGCLELVKYISQKVKQEVNVQDQNGSTALHLACQWWNHKVVKFLINEMNADLHLVDKERRTPLHVSNTSPISKFLVSKGANVLAKDNSGKSPLQFAVDDDKRTIPFLKAATKR